MDGPRLSVMSLDDKRVQVARPVYENSLAVGIVGIALPAHHFVVAGRYFLLPESNKDLDIVEDLLFGGSELKLLP